jgi:hypothetical protein
MPLETATHITDLVVTNPANSDGLNQADDHMRLIKAVLLNDIDDAMTNKSLTVPDGTSAAPTIGFKADATVGLYRKATGEMAVAGNLSGNTGGDVGSLHMFLKEPSSLGKGGTGTGFRYLELDGSTWPNSAFPALATHLGQGGTTFTLPNAKLTGTFPRSRRAGVSEGTVEANQNKAHTHAVTGNTGDNSVDHTHSYSGTTGNDSPDHTHNVPIFQNNGVGGGSTFVVYTAAALNAGGGSAATSIGSGGASTRHAHGFSGTTGANSVKHQHPISLTTDSNGGSEARPEAISVVLCIKT